VVGALPEGSCFSEDCKSEASSKALDAKNCPAILVLRQILIEAQETGVAAAPIAHTYA